MDAREEGNRDLFAEWPMPKDDLKRSLTKAAWAMGIQVPPGGFPDDWFDTVLERMMVHDHCIDEE